MADWPFNSTLDGIDGDKDVQPQWKLLELNILMPGWDCPKPGFFEDPLAAQPRRQLRARFPAKPR